MKSPTPFQAAGYTPDDLFVVTKDDAIFERHDIIRLVHDDGSALPLFERVYPPPTRGPVQYYHALSGLEKIDVRTTSTSKTKAPTPCTRLGWHEGDIFVAIEDELESLSEDWGITTDTVLQLMEDDGDELPAFRVVHGPFDDGSGDDWAYIYTGRLTRLGPPSLDTWKKRFYPLEPNEDMTNKEALEHSIRKWEGLRPEVLKAFNLTRTRTYAYLKGQKPEEEFSVTAGTCALCALHIDAETACRNCPLAAVQGSSCDDDNDDKPTPYTVFVHTGDPEPMIKALKQALELETERSKVYRRGQRFQYDGDGEKYILACPDSDQACLISLRDGNRWTTPVPVAGIPDLTAQEFRLVTANKPHRFTLIEETN